MDFLDVEAPSSINQYASALAVNRSFILSVTRFFRAKFHVERGTRLRQSSIVVNHKILTQVDQRRPEGEAPRPEGEAPRPEGEAPRPEGEAPIPEAGEARDQRVPKGQTPIARANPASFFIGFNVMVFLYSRSEFESPGPVGT